MADGKINRPYGGVLLLGIFLTPLLSLGHDYADGIITAKYFRFAEVVGIGLLLTWMVAWKRNFQFCFRWVDVGVVLFALYGVGSFLLNDFRGETQTLLLILLVGLYFVCRGLGGWKVSQRLLFTFVLLLAGSIEAIWGFLQVYGWADQYHRVVKGTEVATPADLESALKSGDITIVSSSMTIDDSPYISSVASASLSLKEGAVLTAQEGSELQQCIQVSKSCKKMVISGKGSIVGPKNSTATNIAGIYSGCPDLVIDGAITVDGGSGSKGTNTAIRIAEGTTTIKDGYFTVGTDASGIANSCILVATARPSQNAHLKIYGGVFETKGNPINGWYPVINIQDADRENGRATVEIYGGIFVNYNPATGDNTGAADDTFVAPGYKSVQTTYNGQTAWEVVPEN